MTHVPYQEGQFFVLPLERGTFAVGLLARLPARGGVLLGYFFGPRRLEPPTDPAYFQALRAEHAVFVCRFRDAPLYRGQWTLLGVKTAFARADWPVPAFHRYDGGTTLAPGVSNVTDWRVEYGNDNLIVPISETPAAQADLELVDDFAFDARTLSSEVTRRLMLQSPATDDWR
jgi:hypothetical protein